MTTTKIRTVYNSPKKGTSTSRGLRASVHRRSTWGYLLLHCWGRFDGGTIKQVATSPSVLSTEDSACSAERNISHPIERGGKQLIQGTLGLWLMLSSPICTVCECTEVSCEKCQNRDE